MRLLMNGELAQAAVTDDSNTTAVGQAYALPHSAFT